MLLRWNTVYLRAPLGNNDSSRDREEAVVHFNVGYLAPKFQLNPKLVP